MTVTLQAQKRGVETKAAKVRDEGNIPAVAYGAGKDNVSIAFSYKDFVQAFKEAGESSLITLSVEGTNYPVLIQEIQRDPVTDRVSHVDLKIVDTSQTVRVAVPLTFEGEAPAAKAGLGVVGRVAHEIEIEALPQNLPHGLTVSLASLVDTESQIHAKDIALPQGVTLVTDADAVIAVITVQQEEVAEETPIDFSAIEVEKKGKKEEEEAAA